ncbi:MAG TPA: phosphotransferase [Thermoanaerobaculia bacterium]
MLTAPEVARRLIERGLLDGQRSTGRDLVVEDLSRRNPNFRIADASGRAFFLKQNVDGKRRLEREAAIYRLARSRAGARLSTYLPPFHEVDGRVLILGYVGGGETVADHAARAGRLGRSIAMDLGSALAALHETKPATRRSAERPWVFSIGAPPVELLRETSGAQYEVLRIVQGCAGLCRALERLGAAWKPAWLVHGDLRLENALLERSEGEERPRVRLVDWELSGRGDPSWDVGSVIASLLWLWISSLPYVPGMTPDRLARAAGIPLSRIRPAIATFWSAYAAARRLERNERRAVLDASMGCAAARLIQHAWEAMYDETRVTGDIVCAIQAAANVVRAPRRAARELAEAS